jgi:hypothetical protein
MPLIEKVLTLADFDAVPWNDTVAQTASMDCWEYQRLFNDEADRRAKAGEQGREVFEFLAQLCSMMLRPGDRGSPFHPQLVLASGRRSAIPDDLSVAEIDLLAQLYPQAQSPELRARLADLRWELRRDDVAARSAVVAYHEASRSTRPWHATVDRVERALSIAASLGRTGEPFKSLLTTVSDWTMEEWQKAGDKSLAAGLTDVVIVNGSLDTARLAALSDAEGKKLDDAGASNAARRFLQLAADAYGFAKDTAAREAVWRRIADSHLADGRRAVSSGNTFVAPHHYEAAIAALRRLPGGEQERVAELRKELAALQPEVLKAMKRISSSVDISETVEKARAAVAGKPFLEALHILALSGQPPKVSQLRKEVEELAGRTPLKSLIPKVVVDGDGRKLGQRGPLDPSDPKYNRSLEIEMCEHATFYRRVHIAGIVDPMRRQILREHRITERSLAAVLGLNPFVPGDRKLLFARGLYAGFHGDSLIATHLLVPQLENSLRKLLADAGLPVSSMSSEGVEELFGIEVLLRHPVLGQMLGEDALFDLRSLLVERTSSNLRHGFAHGLMSDSDFFSTDCMYLWWLALRLCMLPVIYRQRQTTDESPAQEGAAQSG